jgi:hypothetical protein
MMKFCGAACRVSVNSENTAQYSCVFLKSQVLSALVLGTLSVRDIPIGKSHVGLNLVKNFHSIITPPCT